MIIVIYKNCVTKVIEYLLYWLVLVERSVLMISLIELGAILFSYQFCCDPTEIWSCQQLHMLPHGSGAMELKQFGCLAT